MSAANFTNVQLIPPIDKLKLAQFILYIICASCAMVSSSIVFYTICKMKSLHTKNYYIFAGLAASTI
uniref:Serpentine receptor class gamma n=1 Tax=Romanomermis culicivorax TaxID=13658 RepID=A0A915HZB3_ROMCU